MEQFFNVRKKSRHLHDVLKYAITGLGGIFLLLSVYWLFKLPNPGYAAALMGLGSAFISLYREDDRGHKFLWLLAVGVFLGVELRAINADRTATHKQYLIDRQEQDQKFAEQLNTTISGFKETQQNVNGVLKTTQGVAEVSRQNLLNITGGDSFIYVYPSTIGGDPTAVQLKVHNQGKFALTSVSLILGRLSGGSRIALREARSWTETPIRTINVGVLTGNSGRSLPSPEGEFRVTLDHDLTAQYHIYIGSQKKGEEEIINFRLNKIKNKYEYSFIAWNYEDTGQQHKADIYLPAKDHRNEWRHVLKTQDWKELDWTPPAPFPAF